MRRTTPRLRATAVAAGCAALLAGAMAPSATAAPVSPAGAVSPATATAPYECGVLGGARITLHAAQSGTTGIITLGSDLTVAVPVPANSMSTVLRLEKNGGPGTTTFTGGSNPAIPAGAGIESGPLVGSVAPGDSLDSYLGSGALRFVLFGTVTVSCAATAKQAPGPFVFD
ncbi:hypothetical protein ABZ547_09210 [Streptomyces sparsogenes]|uniref:hypothetical protein n=1 Tax=Streptomyces sparsogenes TaxID=67365 RepID=UPI00340D2E07